MKTPESLETLVDYGIIEEVIRPLMSGKEAQIYVVVAGGVESVAKVYKEANQRTFKHRAEYAEGRRSRSSRDQRAMNKRTRYGRKQDEAAWRSAEVDMIFRLRDAGVRVPEPINFVDGVLVMELVVDAQGNPAPRLGDLTFGATEAGEIYQQLIREVVRMLCAGVVHGDLSEFNVLMGADGPVVIDFPQSVDPAHNQNARKLLLRDVENLHRFLRRFAPNRRTQALAQEMWSLYESNRLAPDTELRGNFRAPEGKANTDEVLALIDDADREEQMRRDARGVETPVKRPKPLRAVVDFTKETRPRSGGRKRVGTRPANSAAGGRGNHIRDDRRKNIGGERGAHPERPQSRPAEKPVRVRASAAEDGGAPKRRRNRRRRRSSTEAGGETNLSGKPNRSGETNPSDQANRSKRRRRGGHAEPRTQSGEVKTGSHGSSPRPAKPAAGARGRSGSATASSGTDRPSRRRRRRPRAAGSRDTT